MFGLRKKLPVAGKVLTVKVADVLARLHYLEKKVLELERKEHDRVFNPREGMERRAAAPGGAELRHVTGKLSTREAGGKRIVEVIIPYNSWSQDMNGWKERIAPGAFARALSGAEPVSVFWAHDAGKVLASTNGKSLTLKDSPAGLIGIIELRGGAIAEDYFEAIRRGDCPDVSFGFWPKRDRWSGVERTLLEVSLQEITIGLHKGGAAYPAAGATAALRAKQERELAELRKKYSIAAPTDLEAQQAALARCNALVAELRRERTE